MDHHLTEVRHLARHRTMAIHRVLVAADLRRTAVDHRRRTSTADLRYTKWARIMLVLADTAQDRAVMAPVQVATDLEAMDLVREAMATVDTEVVLAMEVAPTTEVVPITEVVQITEVVPITEAVPIMEVVHMAVVLTMALVHMDQVAVHTVAVHMEAVHMAVARTEAVHMAAATTTTTCQLLRHSQEPAAATAHTAAAMAVATAMAITTIQLSLHWQRLALQLRPPSRQRQARASSRSALTIQSTT